MIKSSFKEIIIGFNTISAIGLVLLFNFLSRSALDAVIVIPSIIVIVFGLVTAVLNIVYIATRPTRGVIKFAAVLVSLLIVFGIYVSISALVRALG